MVSTGHTRGTNISEFISLQNRNRYLVAHLILINRRCFWYSDHLSVSVISANITQSYYMKKSPKFCKCTNF